MITKDNYTVLASGLEYRWLEYDNEIVGVFIRQNKEGVKNQLVLLTVDEIKEIEYLITLGDALQPKRKVGSTIVSIAGGSIIISQETDMIVISVQEFREIVRNG